MLYVDLRTSNDSASDSDPEGNVPVVPKVGRRCIEMVKQMYGRVALLLFPCVIVWGKTVSTG